MDRLPPGRCHAADWGSVPQLQKIELLLEEASAASGGCRSCDPVETSNTNDPVDVELNQSSAGQKLALFSPQRVDAASDGNPVE